MSLWGNRDRVQDKPKYANTNGSSLYGNTYGVTTAETSHASTKVKGIHSGYVSVKSYVDVHGRTRYKAETLVAGSTINKGSAGHLATVALTGTVSVNASHTIVNGTGTAFTTQLSVGDVIRFGTSSTFDRTVASIANTTQLVISQSSAGARVANALFKLVANTNAVLYTDDTDSSSFFQGN